MDNRNQDVSVLVASLKIINQIGSAILSEQSIEQMIDMVYMHVNQLMDAYSFAIGIYNPESKRIEYMGARENTRKLPAFSIAAHDRERFSGWVFSHRKELLVNDYEREFHLYLPHSISAVQGINPRSLMYVPLFINKEIIGLLSVRTLEKNAYGPQSMEILKTLAVFIARAIENKRSLKASSLTLVKLPESYKMDPLSAREIDVLNLVLKGYTNRSIALELFISANTVKTHTISIYQKLEARNRTEAIFKAKSYGILI